MTKTRAVLAIQAKVTPVGNSGHVVVPKDWIGKRVQIVEVLEGET